MLIQIPIFFGLYKALLYSIELRHSPLFWWIQDLSAKDPYYITRLLWGQLNYSTKDDTSNGRSDAGKNNVVNAHCFHILFPEFPFRTGHLLAI